MLRKSQYAEDTPAGDRAQKVNRSMWIPLPDVAIGNTLKMANNNVIVIYLYKIKQLLN